MAYMIDNPLGSGGYNSQPLGNLTAGLEAIQKTEIEKRLKDIQQQKGWEHDKALADEKWALENMIPPKYDALRKNVDDKIIKLSKELEDFHTNEYVQSIGKGGLSFEDKLKVQRKYREIENTIKDESNFAKVYQEVYQPSAIRIEKTLKDKGQLDKWHEQQRIFGEKLSNPNYKPEISDIYMALEPPPPGAKTLMMLNKPIIDDMIKNANIKGASGELLPDAPTAIKKIKEFIPYDPNNTYQTGVEQKLWSSPDEYAQAAYNLSSGDIRTDPRGRKPTGGGSGINVTKLPELTAVTVEENGQKSKWYNFPQQMSRVQRTYSVGDVLNPETGQIESINREIPLKIVSVNKEKGVIRAEIPGVPLKKKGNPIFSSSGTIGSSLKDKIADANTESELKDKAFDQLAPQSEKPDNWSNATDVNFTQNEDGSYTLTGTLNRYPGEIKKLTKGFINTKKSSGYKPEAGEEPEESQVVSKTYYPVTDDTKSRKVDLPIEEYKGMLGVLDKYRVGNKKLGDYLDEVQEGTTQPQQSQQKQTISVAEYNKAKGTNYTRKQIEDAFGSQYQIED
jgi:hypothetical protein